MIKALIIKGVRADSGATAVEFGIVAPLFVLLVVGVAEVSRALWIEEALADAAARTARCMGLKLAGCVSSSSYSQIATKSYAQSAANTWGLKLPAGNVALETSSSCPGQTGQTSFVTATLTYNYSTVAAALLPGVYNINLTGSACFPQSS
ncbi:Flp pilus assembly protein TadG [Rhodoblastus sphagnicola]|uniref:TadE family protein n=1 Tax=Rhodoblastus sphagnicola TaxID=333368 RepID=UPI0016128630|nr:TadE family protein [Rhodoblastus sphagnicola]MBB4200920.1 Flp pilus assembly protein TadG [Rhodoblastus sphagnicola]